jgi:signal transduction histidine kinase
MVNAVSDARHPQSTPPAWVRWKASRLAEASTDDPWLHDDRVRSFRFVLSIAVAGLALLILRGFLVGGPSPWPDVANALCCVAVLVLLNRRPDRLRPLSWVVLISFLLNALEGLFADSTRPIAPFHMLLPLLVLYGALLGDRWMVLVALLWVLALYGYSAAASWPLSLSDMLTLTNLVFATIVASLTALVVWLQHRRLVENLNSQAHDLRHELDERARLHAILFHDLSNPLTALLNTSAPAVRRTADPAVLLERVDGMAKRMYSIIRSARVMEAGQLASRTLVIVGTLYDQLNEVFSSRLAAKEQGFLLTEGAALAVRAAVPVLCHSVLGNIVSNAIKFSPRGSVIEMAAWSEGDRVRIEVRDQGRGFSREVLRHGARGEEIPSLQGTEGEGGSGYGLRIAALCLDRMEGALEVRNRDSGGGTVSLLLPAESPSRMPAMPPAAKP